MATFKLIVFSDAVPGREDDQLTAHGPVSGAGAGEDA